MSKSIYSKVMVPKPKRSVFDLSYNNAFTARFGELIPCYVEDVLPGDKFRISNASMVRMNPLKVPFMGNIRVTTHTFFVPYRLVWKNWDKFITGGPDGTSAPVMPNIGAGNVAFNGVYSPTPLLDFLNKTRSFQAASGSTSTYNEVHPKVNILDLRAYWKIWNDYYRDQNLQQDLFDDSLTTHLVDGDGTSIMVGDVNTFVSQTGVNIPNGVTLNSIIATTQLAHRAWKKDLFTSALPWAQRGVPVSIPVFDAGVPVKYHVLSGSPEVPPDENGQFIFDLDASTAANNGLTSLVVQGIGASPTTGELVNGTSAASVNIEDLRMANALQRWLEHNALGGSRLKEQIFAHFGVTVPDFRLDRPEFIGGNTYSILSNKVMQTSETSQTPLGTLGGEGFGSGSMKPATYFVREHGIIMTLMSITPESIYSQGVHRRSLKFDHLDYFFPEFENLGEQEIKSEELYVDSNFGSNTKNGTTFGYGPRWYEYKDRVNEVHGLFRTSQAYWVPQRIFSGVPGLNGDFVQINPSKEGSLNNIFAVTDDPAPFQVLVHNSVRAVRPMSKYSRFNF
ncbi:major capsid protein [Tortoise microvirus 49]|nr:major capsid protein [Tortoise microvirus 49]